MAPNWLGRVLSALWQHDAHVAWSEPSVCRKCGGPKPQEKEVDLRMVPPQNRSPVHERQSGDLITVNQLWSLVVHLPSKETLHRLSHPGRSFPSLHFRPKGRVEGGSIPWRPRPWCGWRSAALFGGSISWFSSRDWFFFIALLRYWSDCSSSLLCNNLSELRTPSFSCSWVSFSFLTFWASDRSIKNLFFMWFHVTQTQLLVI